MDWQEFVTDAANTVVDINPQRNLSGNGGGDGGVIAHRLSELERRTDRVELKVDSINDAVIEIKTKLKDLPSKSYVLWFCVCITALSTLTLLGHIGIRSIGAE